MFKQFKQTDKQFTYETEMTKKGAYINCPADNPEAIPIYMTTAFNVEDLAGLQARYDNGGFCYNRNRNPNRNALIELMNHAEAGERSMITSSGMAAISNVFIALAKPGDHIVSSDCLYGESLEVFEHLMAKFGVEYTFVNITDHAAVIAAFKPNTKFLYTETVSNPMIGVADLPELAKIAHDRGAIAVVDNTFATGVGVQPLKHGFDLVVNSLTKFYNGHSDMVAGSVTGSDKLVGEIYNTQLLLGNTCDAFNAWLCMRGMRTLNLRIEKQMENAEKLAKALASNPHVLKVNHPSLPDHPQHEIAKKIFRKGYGGILSFVLPDDKEKIDAFMRKLNLAHYAMTLGGYRSSLSHPVMSSHSSTPEEERIKMGITWGLLRLSVGIEDSDDLVNDFMEALKVFD